MPHGRKQMPPVAPSVDALWRAVRARPALLVPVALAIAYSPDGDLELAADAMRGHDGWEDACAAVQQFFEAKDGPLDKRRGDFVELVAWGLGPFRIGREGGPCQRHHEAALVYNNERICSPEERVDVVFQVQDRTECVECKANASVWYRSPRAARKVAYLRCLSQFGNEDDTSRSRGRPRWSVSLVTMEDRPLLIEGVEVINSRALRALMASGR